MDVDVDHYSTLGLPSGEEGAKLSEKEITKAYRARALKLHPDKRPDDPEAHEKFQKLKVSYNVLKDEKARKLFDDHLRVKREHQRRRSEQEAKHDSKRRRMVSDLEERERAASSAHPDPAAMTRQEEEKIARKLAEEIARIRQMLAKEMGPKSAPKEESSGGGSGLGLDKKKVLKVSWEKSGSQTAEKLKEVFSKFGKVEDVVIKITKKRESALVVMESEYAAAAATRTICGDHSNPLQVEPLVQPSVQTTFSGFQQPVQNVEVDSNLVGVGYEDFEDSVLKKLQKYIYQCCRETKKMKVANDKGIVEDDDLLSFQSK